MRSDPDRRQAAVDGFTRLIEAMVSIQFYDPLSFDELPVEATVLKAESARTASLFATMLHGNTQQSGALSDDESLSIGTHTGGAGTIRPPQMHIYRTVIDAGLSYRTVIAVAGQHVIQVSANTRHQSLLDDYAMQVMLELEHS